MLVGSPTIEMNLKILHILNKSKSKFIIQYKINVLLEWKCSLLKFVLKVVGIGIVI